MKRNIIILSFTAVAGLLLLATGCSTNKEKEYEYVDLGLSVKWATCNVGATAPEEYGNYYAWGEVLPKNDYSWETYKYCNGTYDSMIKYCTDSSFGTVDEKTKLEAMDDVASVNLGGTCHIPTYDEWEELVNKCTWKWTTRKGVKGYVVKSMINGNSIFLPAAGSRYGTNISTANIYGAYWSKNCWSYDWGLYSGRVYFNSNIIYRDSDSRDHGLSIRPVCP